MTLYVSDATAPVRSRAETTTSWPGFGRGGVAMTFLTAAPRVPLIEFTAFGVPRLASEAPQFSGRRLSEERLRSSRVGPLPSGAPGHGSTSAKVTVSAT